MPLEKYRGVEVMPPTPMPPAGPARTARLRGLWETWARLVPPLDLPGLRRYRTMEDADADREAALQRRVRRLEERGRGR